MTCGTSLSMMYDPSVDEMRNFRELLTQRDVPFMADLIEALSQECGRRDYPVQAVELRDVAEALRFDQQYREVRDSMGGETNES